MKVSQKKILDRLEKIEAKKEKLGDPKKLFYTDGRIVETRDSLSVKAEEIGAFFDWMGYVEGTNNLPALQKTINLKMGEVWDFEEDARRPSMTDEEAEELADKVFAEFMERGAF